MLSAVRRLLARDRKPHLWRCPLTRRYHDPRVLMRSLCALAPFTVDGIRAVLGARIVSADGAGFAEAQVEAAYLAFTEWHAGKGGTARTSPTSAPSTDSPAA